MKLIKNISQITIYFIIATVLWTGVIGLLYYWMFLTDKQNSEGLALYQARAFFQEIITVRSWNAIHGGVYVPITETTQPNPYLEDSLRDIQTIDGMKLTKINPANMTRLISDIISKDADIRFHITSEKPIRPANAPDEWEKISLKLFSAGVPEKFEFIELHEDTNVFRYMAPLLVEKSCLQCHSKQGYKEGDIRGGISVTMNAENFLALQSRLFKQRTYSFVIIWIVGLFILGYGSSRLKKSEQEKLFVIDGLNHSLSEIRELKGLLPICSSCKKIRDDKGYWNQLEVYIQTHTDAKFTHGICPDCAKKLYPDYYDKK